MLTKAQEEKLDKILAKAEKDEDILAVMLYGSRISEAGDETPDSDLDICLILDRDTKHELQVDGEVPPSRKRLDYLSEMDPEKIDLQIFQHLPIYIRKRILEKGKLEYCRDKNKLYELVYRTIQEYEDFAPRMREYLEGVKNG